MNIEKAEERAKEVEETRLHTATATVFLRPVIPVSPPIHPPPPPPTTEQQSQESQRVWSTMTTQIETSTSVKQWSTPAEKIVEGHPPGPDDKPSTLEGEARSGMLRGITPNYKLGTERPDSRIDLPHSGHIPNADGDYKVKQQQDHYKLTVIDPKVRSSANMPAYSTGVPDPRRSRAGDFPSEHTKRSFVKVDPLEQRKLKAVDTRAISTSAYLTESHQPPKNDESLRELDSIKERIATLQKAAAEPKKVPDVAAVRRDYNEAYARRIERYNSLPQLTQPSAVIQVKDDKPRSIMKRRELENREQMLYPAENYRREVVREVVRRPVKTETVQRFEQTRRTEEVERRVQRKERKDRRSRHHSSSRREEWRDGGHGGQWRSSSLSRHGGYLPSNESYFRQTTTKRDNSNSRGGGWEDDRFGSGIAHARYGSLSDSLRRGELKYVPNGEVRESHWRDGGGRSGHSVHKSYSTRDVFDDRAFDHHSMASHGGRRSSQGTQPLVEFPPTLPRRGRDDDFRPMHKARSFADWDDQGRAGWRHEESALQHRRRDDDMSRLEDEFRDSLLMPMPNGNMHERDHRTEQIPGGYETHHKENRSNAGRRVNRDGVPVDFNEATQEYSYKREQETDRRR